MLIIDGAKYQLWTPKDEEKEFHPMVKENSKEIFGENSVYFDVKLTLRSTSGIGSIPDAYVIKLSKPYEWYVIENELANHPIYDHVIKQLSKFINGIENQNATKQILITIYEKINEDLELKARVKKIVRTEDIHHFLSNLFSTPPRIVIVIDKKTSELEEATKVLKFKTDIIEFQTFSRVNAENIRAHIFEPLIIEQPIPDSNLDNYPKVSPIIQKIGTVNDYEKNKAQFHEKLEKISAELKNSYIEIIRIIDNLWKEKGKYVFCLDHAVDYRLSSGTVISVHLQTRLNRLMIYLKFGDSLPNDPQGFTDDVSKFGFGKVNRRLHFDPLKNTIGEINETGSVANLIKQVWEINPI